jgi:hypothetical protein
MSTFSAELAHPFSFDCLERMVVIAGAESSLRQRISFTITGTNKQHARLRDKLGAKSAIATRLTFRDPEED